MVNVEELGSHQSMPSAVRSSLLQAAAHVSEASQNMPDLWSVEAAVRNESKRADRRPFLLLSTNQRQLARWAESCGSALKKKISVIFAKIEESSS